MTFNDILQDYQNINLYEIFNRVTNEKICRILAKEQLTVEDFIMLISPKAQPVLEEMARKARKLTLQYFGRTIGVYIPLYLSNYCENNCLYCGFSSRNKIKRSKLTLCEVEEEFLKIAETGMKHVLLLTGEAPQKTSMDYLLDCVRIAKKFFSSVSIEMFPMETKEYQLLKEEGVDGLTVYQETYDRNLYKEVHLAGKKADFDFRLNTPERGCLAGFRSVNIGPLFGLGDIYREAFSTALHAKYLMDKYLDTEISISMPRMNAAEGDFKTIQELDDITYVQFMLAFRIFLPRLGITVSTREVSEFRDNLIGIGVTKFSAGSKTEVGGYAHDDGDEVPQFEISDNRSAGEIFKMIKEKGFQPVYKDWEQF